MLAAALIVALAGAPDGAAIELQWDAPPECPAGDDVQQRATALADAAGVEMPERVLVARGTIRALPIGYALDLHVEGARDSGDRHLEAKSCAELAHAAALILSLALDPNAAPDLPRADRKTPTAPEPVATNPATAPVAGPRAPSATPTSSGDGRRAAPIAAAMRAGIGIDGLLWRPVGPTLALGVALLGRHYRVELGGRYAIPSAVASPSNPALRARAQQWSVGLGACGVPTFIDGVLELPLCGGFEAGAMHAEGIGTALVGRRASAPWIAIVAGPSLIGRVSQRLGLWIGVDAVVLAGRPVFSTDGGTDVVDPRRAGLRMLAGVEFRPRRGAQ